MTGAIRFHESHMMRFRNRAAAIPMTSAKAARIKNPPSPTAFFILYSTLLLAFPKWDILFQMASLALSKRFIVSPP